MRKRIINFVIVLMALTMTAGCRNTPEQNTSVGDRTAAAPAVETTETAKTDDPVVENIIQPTETAAADTAENQDPVLPAEPTAAGQQITEEVKEKMLRMMIGNTAVAVEWEKNESVRALEALCAERPIVIQMSMYGGFEQVGPIGSRLPSNDVQTTTTAGDIVLYSSNQIVVFYGSNSWSYTRFGHITDRDTSGMAALLRNGNVTVTISME